MLLNNRICDESCNVPLCGSDQGVCRDNSQLPCEEWCHTAGLLLYKQGDFNLDGIISGDLEWTFVKTIWDNSDINSDSVAYMGIVASIAMDLGVAPPGVNCWGCDALDMYNAP